MSHHYIAQLAGAVEYKCPRYDTKQSDGEVQVMLGPWGILSTPSLPLLQRTLWPGVVTPDAWEFGYGVWTVDDPVVKGIINLQHMTLYES